MGWEYCLQRVARGMDDKDMLAKVAWLLLQWRMSSLGTMVMWVLSRRGALLIKCRTNSWWGRGTGSHATTKVLVKVSAVSLCWQGHQLDVELSHQHGGCCGLIWSLFSCACQWTHYNMSECVCDVSCGKLFWAVQIYMMYTKLWVILATNHLLAMLLTLPA